MNPIYQRTRPHPDRTVRCYLTYRCDSQCSFCSAQIPEVPETIRDMQLYPDIWAEGLNRRCRHSILAGGEPFMYDYFDDLIGMLDANKYKIEIYTNLNHPVDDFLAAARGKYSVLASLHPNADRALWLANVEALAAEQHAVRIHVVRADGYEELQEFIRDAGLVERFRTALQGDQRAGIKSSGIVTNRAHLYVNCKHRIFLFGPDGFRYHCVHKMMTGQSDAVFGHIAGEDEDDWTVIQSCEEFGLCAGCDNNIEGTVIDGPSPR